MFQLLYQLQNILIKTAGVRFLAVTWSLTRCATSDRSRNHSVPQFSHQRKML